MRDFTVYYKAMSQNIYEKIDFVLEELKTSDYKKVIDFGCADGQILRELAEHFPQIQFIGYDINNEIIKLNIKNNPFENINYVSQNITDYYDNTTLVIFSSVLHEIFSFLPQDEIKYILDETAKVKAVAIRDMYFLKYSGYDNTEKSKSFYLNNINDIMFQDFIKQNAINKNNINPNYVAEFLMKKRYITNWKEELLEYYFATPYSIIEKKYINANFILIFKKLYMNEYLSKEIPNLKDFTKTTHMKLIFKKV